MASTPTRRGTSWRVEWRYGGKRDGQRESLTVHTLAEAKDVKREAERFGHVITATELSHRMFGAAGGSEPVPTVFEWVTRHVASIAPVISAGTLQEYERTIRIHIEPAALGATPLTSVRREDVQRWIGELVRRPLKPKSVENHYIVFASAIRAAVDGQIITANPCHGVTLPRADDHTEEEHHYLTVNELDTLTAALYRPYRPLVTFLARSGLRWGEATALRVGDVTGPSVRVERAWQKETKTTGRILGAPKTYRSRRTVSLDAVTMAALEPLLMGREPDEWLFTAPDGERPVARQTFRDHWLKAVATIDKPATPHDLRHTHASWLIAAGVPLPVIQRRLGHSSITTTIDTYGHLAPDADLTVLAALNEVGDAAQA